jgi:DNA repair protein RadC
MKNYTKSGKSIKVSEVQLKYIQKVPKSERFKITSSRSANDLVRTVIDDDQIDLNEKVHLICMNNSNDVIAVSELSVGSSNGCLVDIKNVLVTALKVRACGLILLHNHPSGTLRPSNADRDLTKRVKEAAKMIDISLLDHLIYTRESYVSFADESWL